MIGFDDLLVSDEFIYTWCLDEEKERKRERMFVVSNDSDHAMGY